jgi:transcriptional regulator with XRE-family HTH domain
MDGRRVDEAAARRLGRNLFMARRRAGFSQEELGALACLHRTEVGFIESGRRLPRVDTLLKLSSALDVRPEELLEASNGSCPLLSGRAASPLSAG